MNFEHRVGVYMINCDKHVQRLKNFEKYAEKANLKYKRQKCVNGSRFTDRVIWSMFEKGVLSTKSEMTPIEVSINLSFMKVWTKIVNSRYDYGIILEDDVSVSKSFVHDVNQILTSLEGIPFDVVYLHNGNFALTKSAQKKVVKTLNNIQILRETKGHNAGGPAYIISKAFCRYMLAQNKPIKYPHDMVMGYSKGKKLFTVQMKKSGECWTGVKTIVKVPCDGEYGTGQSTQNYDAENIRDIYKRLKKTR